jgi:hypothetical protein
MVVIGVSMVLSIPMLENAISFFDELPWSYPRLHSLMASWCQT